MKWTGLWTGSKARGLQTAGVSLAVGLGMTACSRDYTVAYVYATSITKGTTGVVNEYQVDYQSGAMTPLPQSAGTGRNPVGLVASPNQQNLYVINNGAPDSSVEQFSIGTDGKLYNGSPVPVVSNSGNTITGTGPTAIAIDPAGAFLYVTFQYQNGFTTANPGPGGVAVFPIAADGTIGTAVMNGTLPYFPVGNNPSGIVVSPRNGYVYVIDQEGKGTPNAFGVLLAFKQNTDGTLTALPGPIAGGFAAGTSPAGIAEDPGANFIYVTDSATNQLYGYLSNNGAPLAMNSSPFATGTFPLGVTVDPRGLYVYVANYGSETVSAYAIKTSSGALSGVSGGTGNTLGTGPTCVSVEPALGVYLFTSNQLDNSISGEKLNPNTGALSAVQGTPFTAAALPSCLVAVANGAHATQLAH